MDRPVTLHLRMRVRSSMYCTISWFFTSNRLMPCSETRVDMITVYCVCVCVCVCVCMGGGVRGGGGSRLMPCSETHVDMITVYCVCVCGWGGGG